jgi:hypothetical protein
MVLKIGFVILVGRVFSVQVLDALAFFFSEASHMHSKNLGWLLHLLKRP